MSAKVASLQYRVLLSVAFLQNIEFVILDFVSQETFISKIFVNQFSNCTVLFVGHNHNHQDLVNIEKTVQYILLTNGLPVSIVLSKNISHNHQSVIVSSKLQPRYSGRCRLTVIDNSQLAPDTSTEIIQALGQVQMIRLNMDPFIFLSSQKDMRLVLDEFPKLQIRYRIAVGIENEKVVKVATLCLFFSPGGNPLIQFLPINSDQKIYFVDYTKNLNGHLLRISVPAVTARVQLTRTSNQVNNGFRGIWVAIFHEYLQQKLNFSYYMFLSRSKDGGPVGAGGTGFQLPNGTWTGTVGDLVAGSADVSLLTAKTPARIKYISFTDSYADISYLNFITTKGSRIFSPVALLWPFRKWMWASLFISTLVALLTINILILTTRSLGMTKKLLQSVRRGVMSKKEWGFKEQIYFIITSYLDQTCVMPNFTPLRCFVALWLFFVFIVTTVYRSKMVSLLAFPVLETIPETYQQLVKSGYKIGFLKHGDAAYNVLKASKDPVYSKIVRDMEVITGDGVDCMERVLKRRKYACIAYSVSTVFLKNRNFSDEDIRNFVIAPETTFSIYVGLTFQKDSVYLETMNKWISWTTPFHLPLIWEATDMYYNVRLKVLKWWKETNQMDKLPHTLLSKNSEDDLNLKHVSGAFYVLLFCYAISLLVFLLEKFIVVMSLRLWI